MANIFQEAEAWDTSTDTMLPVGNHVVTISGPQMTETRTGKPQIELRVENGQGSMKDWLVITTKSIGRVVQVFDAAGVDRPQDGEFDPNTLVLTDKCVDRLHNKKVGVVVREEPDYNDPTKMRKRIQGYIAPDQIEADVPIDMVGLNTNAGPRPVADDDVPF